ncbi:hypothetical protein [Lapillicoccus sp.]|uniref:hypothetical protein n=1 Tax=Lapillicoccus sp. TaxID=1909287 RepID=UPI0025DD831B|nr:hypothetical protein [Lapillicoccus sp.]
MDPDRVRGVGGRIGEVGQLARSAADTLSHLEVPHARVTVDQAAAAFLRVWGDALLALATELRVLDELCSCSAAGVVRDDEAARFSYAAPASARTRTAVAG